MSSDWQYIEDHMGGHDEDGFPNFMSKPGFYDEEDSYAEEDKNDSLEIEFNIGDIVKLNSSDVLMTIKSLDNNLIECRWFDKNNHIQNDKFNIAEIILVDKARNYQNSSNSEIEEINIDEDEMPF